jgi:class 3 adenylate cyclase
MAAWTTVDLKPVGTPGQVDDINVFVDAMSRVFEPAIASRGTILSNRFVVDEPEEGHPDLVAQQRLTAFFPPSRYRILEPIRIEPAPGAGSGFGFTASAFRQGAEILLDRTQKRRTDVVASVIFTDVVDSTDFISEHGDRPWIDLMLRHRRLVRSLTRQHRGAFWKGTGDGFLITLPGIASIKTIELIHQLAESLRSHGLNLRAGLHWGQFSRLEDDVAGIEVNVASRLMGLAGADELVLSGAAYDLLSNEQPGATAMGPVSLKGVLPSRWLAHRLRI